MTVHVGGATGASHSERERRSLKIRVSDVYLSDCTCRCPGDWLESGEVSGFIIGEGKLATGQKVIRIATIAGCDLSI